MLKLFYFLQFSTLIFAETRIINGENAEENEFPFMVSLQVNGRHYCGGTILNPINILTAAHCVCNEYYTKNIQLLRVVLTPDTLNSPKALNFEILNITCHNWDVLEQINDVAILKLKTAIPKSVYHPVTLPSENFTTQQTLPDALLLGWGITQDTNTSNHLQKVHVVIYNDAICEKSHNGIRNIEHQICAGWPENGRGSCQGDSGGPLLINQVQIGVISIGLKNCSVSDEKNPKILARVTRYLEWIMNNVEDYDRETTTEGGGGSNGFVGVLSVNCVYYFILFASFFLS